MSIKEHMQKLGLGMRTVKTGIAVFFCLCAGAVVEVGFFPLYACIAAIVTMQDTPAKTVKTGKTRLIGTGIGAVIGIVSLWIDSLYSYPLFQIVVISLSVILGLAICYVLKQKEACSICAVVITVTLIGHTTEDMVVYSVSRAVETALGVIIAIPVNRYLWPNGHEDAEETPKDPIEEA